jgi:hypothetical protein
VTHLKAKQKKRPARFLPIYQAHSATCLTVQDKSNRLVQTIKQSSSDPGLDNEMKGSHPPATTPIETTESVARRLIEIHAVVRISTSKEFLPCDFGSNQPLQVEGNKLLTNVP